ncbi:unnamed protein product [Rotaria sp. Silwood2]|nr:unnamed protein product [Rotaria sp. Silwood2]
MRNSGSLPQDDTCRGFIIGPNFPNKQNNINCTYNLQTLKPYQNICLYILEMNFNNPNSTEHSCTKDRLFVFIDNNIMEMYGRSYTNTNTR